MHTETKTKNQSFFLPPTPRLHPGENYFIPLPALLLLEVIFVITKIIWISKLSSRGYLYKHIIMFLSLYTSISFLPEQMSSLSLHLPLPIQFYYIIFWIGSLENFKQSPETSHSLLTSPNF